MSEISTEEKIAAIKEWLGTGSINIFGRAFAGKDFQGLRLSKALDAPDPISSGDILRRSVIPADAKALIESGELSPTDVFSATVLPYLGRTELAGRPLILSTVGRKHGEEPGVMHALEQSNHALKAILVLNITEEDAWNRLAALNAKNDARGERTDDSESGLIKRLELYNTDTSPVLEFYEQRNLKIDIDASKSKDDVFNDIISELYAFSRK